MEQTLHGCDGCANDRVAVDKVSYRFGDPSPGDVVVFKGPPAWLDNDEVGDEPALEQPAGPRVPGRALAGRPRGAEREGLRQARHRHRRPDGRVLRRARTTSSSTASRSTSRTSTTSPGSATSRPRSTRCACRTASSGSWATTATTPRTRASTARCRSATSSARSASWCCRSAAGARCPRSTRRRRRRPSVARSRSVPARPGPRRGRCSRCPSWGSDGGCAVRPPATPRPRRRRVRARRTPARTDDGGEPRRRRTDRE